MSMSKMEEKLVAAVNDLSSEQEKDRKEMCGE